ncbi:merR HTH regulatory family protein [Neorickettsia helminthoeca str. Oregon]|uniref:MerR HTH regulatory family protein n=1 Tax=Neorickettsia helminthoeca str. Oregon TaxID=1286528 RepID=X5H3F8_9RICK|nr:MerR family transcriptional regulator [Neorickettsia helminthoeca]AHX11233.1 merR HTH regulatory family protein [Neorickettsia helminthoeca str. Oregon]
MFRVEKEKLYYSIKEAAGIVGLKEYVLRYWETQFPKLLNPKRQSGKRLYTRSDINTIRKIQELLHVKGMTIKGAAMALESRSKYQEAESVIEQLKSLRDFLKKFSDE